MLFRSLRYHRQTVETSVDLSWGKQRKAQGALVNLSQGGIGIYLEKELDVRQPLQISFRLPGTRKTVRARGEIAWTDQRGNAGIRFLEVPEQLQRNLQLWLAQRYFGN